jgi:hypothetical protein
MMNNVNSRVMSGGPPKGDFAISVAQAFMPGITVPRRQAGFPDPPPVAADRGNRVAGARAICFPGINAWATEKTGNPGGCFSANAKAPRHDCGHDPLARLHPSSSILHPSAFTLIEVLLTLGLSCLLMIVVGLAIDLHLRLLRTGRAEVEQAQLARAILHRISQDLHNAVQYNLSAPNSLGSSSSSNGNGGGGGGGGGGGQNNSNTANLANATSLPPVPGIYGNANELQIDVSRLPRLDQMQAILSPDTTTTTALTQDVMSDVKTVLYFLAGSSSGGGSTASGDGLYRREMDRAVASFATTQGGQAMEDTSNQEPLAAEVVDIEFQYYDGNEWVSEWDSTENNGLPMAVEISLTITKPQHSEGLRGMSGGGSSNSAKESDAHTYTLMVSLPVAQPTTVQSSGTTDSTPPLSGGM